MSNGVKLHTKFQLTVIAMEGIRATLEAPKHRGMIDDAQS